MAYSPIYLRGTSSSVGSDYGPQHKPKNGIVDQTGTSSQTTQHEPTNASTYMHVTSHARVPVRSVRNSPDLQNPLLRSLYTQT